MQPTLDFTECSVRLFSLCGSTLTRPWKWAEFRLKASRLLLTSDYLINTECVPSLYLLSPWMHVAAAHVTTKEVPMCVSMSICLQVIT